MCMYLGTIYYSAVETRRGHQTSQNSALVIVSCPSVQGTKPRSSGRTQCTRLLNHFSSLLK